MKILYIASERSRAQVATRALRTLSPSVTVLWGSNFERAAFSILENPDLAALIVEIQSDSHGCSYLKQMATLGVEAPVVMVLPEGAGSPKESLKAGAGGYVEKGPSFQQALPAVVGRTIGSGQPAPVIQADGVHSETIAESAAVPPVDRRAPQDTTRPNETERRVSRAEIPVHQQEQRRSAEQSGAAQRHAKLEAQLHQERQIRAGLEQKLADAQAALQDAEQRHRSATTAAAAVLADRRREYETGRARTAATQETLEEQLRQSRQSHASAVSDLERLTQRNAELTSMLAEATATGKDLEHRLAHLETALDVANERAARDHAGSARRDAAREAELQAQLEQEVEKGRNLGEDLARARRAQDEAETQRTSAVTAATALWADRQAHFEAELAEATEIRNTLSREARDLKDALDHARETIHAHAADVERLTQREAELTSQLAEAATMRTALEDQRELQTQLDQEVEKRRNAEVELARVKTALDNVEKPHSSVVAVANALLAKRQAQFDAGLAETAEARRRSSELEAALGHAEQNLQAHAADVERLTQREAELTSQLADATAMRNTLERKLTDAADALKDAIEGSSRNRLTSATKAAEREREFEALIRQERSTRADVEQRLAQAEATLREAERRHAAAVSAGETERAEREAHLDIQLSQTAAQRDDIKRQFSDAETALASARHDHAAAATEVERLTEREAELTSQLAEASAMRGTLERQLIDAADTLKAAEEGANRDRAATETRIAAREGEFERLISHERATRADVEQRLAQVEAVLHEANQQHTGALAAATTNINRLSQREAELTSELAEAATLRTTLERQLTATATALKDAEEDAVRDRAATETRAAEREGEFDRLIGHERTARAEVEQRLAKADTAFREAKQQHTAALSAAATEIEHLTQRQIELTSELAEAATLRTSLERQLTTTATALKNVEEDAIRDGAAAETRAAEREAEFERLIGDERTARAEVEQRLAQVDAALREANQQHTAARAAAATEIERLTQREAEVTSQLADAAAMRSTLERQLTDAADSLKAANEGATRDRLAAETSAAERQREFEQLIGHERAARAEVEQRLAQIDAALHDANQQHTAARAAAATEIERLTQREATLASQLAQAEAALRHAEQKHTLAMTAAATERAERQAQFDAELSQTAATRDEFKRRFSDAETALAAARHDHAAAATEVDRLTQREADLTSQLAEAAATRSTLERQLTDAADVLKAANESATRDRVTAETKAAERQSEFELLIGRERTARADVEQRLEQEIARRESLDRTVAEMHSAAANAEQRFRDEIATLTARARDEARHLENQFANEREGHTTRQAALLNEIQGLNAARDAANESLSAMREQSRRREIEYQHERDGLDRARLTAEADVRRLGAELTQARHDLEKARQEFQHTLDRVTGEHADSLAKLVVESAERDARIEDLKKQLDENRRELRRQFQDAPLPLWRCTRDGALTDANRALAHLVGYRESEELRDADFVKTVFESTDDLAWLIERCLSTKTRQSVETAWKRRNDERLVVRLSATQFGPDTIELAVEDITNVHVLEDRLARAHRMAAVGGLASETAVTCGRLLRDVREDGQQWLMAVSDDSALRKRGERLLGEVARAATYLERLAAHGDEQASALKPVELNRVLRDLKPVLKHVAGDDVDLELSKTSSPLNVDMKADRVERLFVNLASYGRERMPIGGRLRIELATVVVDQKFIADHPNVRRGHHALITVTAMRRETPAAGTPHTGTREPDSGEVGLEKPGVDLGALQELLQECGGHLWLTADPPGNMVVKLRLPLRVWDDRPHSTTSDTPTGPKRAMARWFRH